jgi:hypothetical protein
MSYLTSYMQYSPGEQRGAQLAGLGRRVPVPAARREVGRVLVILFALLAARHLCKTLLSDRGEECPPH